jgi:hypothetical protein
VGDRARVPGQRQLSLELGDPFVGCGQLVGLHTRDAFDHARIGEAWRFHRNSLAWQIPVSAATTATGSPDRSRETICRRTVAGHVDLLMITRACPESRGIWVTIHGEL